MSRLGWLHTTCVQGCHFEHGPYRTGLKHKSIVDSRLRPRCRTLTNSTKHSIVLTSNGYRHLANSSEHSVALDSSHCLHGMTSSVKPEVRNLSQRLHRRTEPRPKATCTENLVRFVQPYSFQDIGADRQTDRQTDKL